MTPAQIKLMLRIAAEAYKRDKPRAIAHANHENGHDGTFGCKACERPIAGPHFPVYHD